MQVLESSVGGLCNCAFRPPTRKFNHLRLHHLTMLEIIYTVYEGFRKTNKIFKRIFRSHIIWYTGGSCGRSRTLRQRQNISSWMPRIRMNFREDSGSGRKFQVRFARPKKNSDGSGLETRQDAKTGLFQFGFKTLQSKLGARKAKLLQSFKNTHLYSSPPFPALSSLSSCSLQIIFPLHSFPQTMNGHPRNPRVVE